MDRSRILEKIKKALALADNAAATPGEAVAALNSAQKMMAHYGVTEKELGAVGYGHEAIKTAVQAGKSIPAYLSAMTALVRRAFGVECVFQKEIRRTDANWTINYFGPDHRVAMACYTHTVLFRAVEKGWAEHLARNQHLKKERGARTGYVMGWMDAVAKQVMELRMTEEEKAGTAIVKAQLFPDVRKNNGRNMSIDRDALNAGRADGNAFKIHRPMNGGASETKMIGA
jgi:hypothetical protein